MSGQPGFDLATFERTAEAAYASHDSATRARAEADLAPLLTYSVDQIPLCRSVLAESASPHACLLVINVLDRIIELHWRGIVETLRLQLRDFLLSAILERHATFGQACAEPLLSLLCRILKVGWYDSESYRGVVDRVVLIAGGHTDSPIPDASRVVAMRLLASLVAAISHNSDKRFVHHRKTLLSFRDHALTSIWACAFNQLKAVLQGQSPIADEAQRFVFCKHVLQVLYEVLDFDFTCSAAHTTATDDLCHLNPPEAFGPILLAPEVLQALMQTYEGLAEHPSHASLALSCIVQLSGCKRSLFSPNPSSAPGTPRIGVSGSLLSMPRGLATSSAMPHPGGLGQGGLGVSEMMGGASNATQPRLGTVHAGPTAGPVYRRVEFTAALLEWQTSLFESKRGMSDLSNYHQFCRLLYQMKSFYLMKELASCAVYPKWLAGLAAFTTASLANYEYALNSVHFLMKLWSRLVSCLEFSGDEPLLVDNYAHVVLRAYVDAHLAVVSREYADPGGPMEDPLSAIMVLQMADAVKTLAHCRYEFNRDYFLDLLRSRVGSLLEPQIRADLPSRCRAEGELAWIVQVVAAVISGRLYAGNEEADGQCTAEVFKCILSLMQLPDAQAPPFSYSRKVLETAFLAFMDAFRLVYVNERTSSSSHVYPPIRAMQLSVSDAKSAVSFIVSKLLSNIQGLQAFPEELDHTLDLFQELVSGYLSSRLVVGAVPIRDIIENHSIDMFPFQRGTQTDPEICRKLYQVLTSLLLKDERIRSTPMLLRFLQPFGDVLTSAAALNPAVFQNPASQECRVLLFVLHDLFGVARACEARETFTILFSFLQPHWPFIASVSALPEVGSAELHVALLTLVGELVVNRQQRLSFHDYVPHGFVIFRNVCLILTSFTKATHHIVSAAADCAANDPSLSPLGQMGAAQRSQTQSGMVFSSTDDAYARGLKLALLAADTLTKAITTKVCNFAVFYLYGDSCLTDTVASVLRLFAAIPADLLITFPRLVASAASLYEKLTEHFMPLLCSAQIEPATILHMWETLASIITYPIAQHSTAAAAAIGNMASYIVEALAFQAAVGSDSANHPPPDFSGQDAPTLADQLTLPAAALVPPMGQNPLSSQPGELAMHLINQLCTATGTVSPGQTATPEQLAASNTIVPVFLSLAKCVLFEEPQNVWSLSRPILPLMRLAMQPCANALRDAVVDHATRHGVGLAIGSDVTLNGAPSTVTPEYVAAKVTEHTAALFSFTEGLVDLSSKSRERFQAAFVGEYAKKIKLLE
jgi:hypothetical protein